VREFVFEGAVEIASARKLSGNKRGEGTEIFCWWVLRKIIQLEEQTGLLIFRLFNDYQDSRIKEDAMGWTRGPHGSDSRRMQSYGLKAW